MRMNHAQVKSVPKAFNMMGQVPVRAFAVRDWDPSKDYYKVLGVKKTASHKEIKIAYYKMC